MLKQPKKGPELRGNASQIRGLVPCAADLCACFPDEEPFKTAAAAAALLAQVYSNLSHNSFNANDMSVSMRKFMALYVALEQHSDNKKLWRFKPKFHLAMHLVESGSNPADFWNYRDEDFGGAVAALSRRRGGKNSPLATARRMLNCYCVKHKVPRL